MIKFDLLFLYLLLLIVGLLLLGYSIKRFRNTLNLINNSTITTGNVIKLIEREDSEGSSFDPIISYIDNNQRNHEHQFNTSFVAPRIGDKVKIIFDNRNPDNVRIYSFWGIFKSVLWLFILSTSIITIGIGYLVYRIRLNG